MIGCAFRIDEGPKLTSIDAETVPQVLTDTSARVWLDLQGTQTEEVGAWLDRLDIHRTSRRLCLEARTRPGFYPQRDELLFVVPVLAEASDSQETDHVVFLCRDNLLLTLHGSSIFEPERIGELDESESWLAEQSVAALVAALLVDLSQVGLRHTGDLRARVRELDQRLDRDPEAVELDAIRDTRSDLIAVGTTISDQIPQIRSLSTVDRPYLRSEGAPEILHCALVNFESSYATLSRLEKHLGALRSGMEMHAQDKTNRRLGMLTILSAIFMPITLLAGIWGMNFETMPELKLPFSYPIALAFMALIGFAMYRFFRRGGWF